MLSHEKDKYIIVGFTNFDYPRDVTSVYMQLMYLLLVKSSRFSTLVTSWYLFFSSPEDIFINFRERRGAGGRKTETERQRERNMDGLVASHTCPYRESNPQVRHVPQLGIKPTTLWCTGQRSNQLRHLARSALPCIYVQSCDSPPLH